MTDSMKECRCGQRRIPKDWRVCGVCEQYARLDALDGSAEHRQYRHHALKQADWPNRNVKSPLTPEELALLAEGISRRAQEQSLLGLRHVHRQFHDQRIRVRNAVHQANIDE